jgi:hypothetical protein
MSKARELAELGAVYDSGALSNRNIIVNGAMQISQRGTSFTTVANGTYTLDRFNYRKSNDGNVTVTQDSSGPDGFSNSLKVDVTTADSSLSASQLAILEYNVEAQDLQRLAFGTSGAKNFTLSFYVKSNKTGTYAVNISQNDNSSKQATLNYTIDAADTWERKSLTFTGDTSGVINDDNGIGFLMYWWLAVGTTYTSGGSTSAAFQTYSNANAAAGHAVNLLDDTSNEWLITGIQLEVGSEATPFEHRSFGDELARCQRYFEKADIEGSDTYRISINRGSTANSYYWAVDFRTTKRAKPTCTLTQDFDDNLTLSVHSAATGRNHMGIKNATGGSTDTRALGELTAWTADAEL